MHKLRMALAVVSVLAVGCSVDQEPGAPDPSGDDSAPPPATNTQPLTPLRPVVGGHLLVTADGLRVAMADVEGDRLRVFSVATMALDSEVALPPKSWPTRVLEGRNGELYVLLRGAGAIATVRGSEVTVTQVCSEPRALALGPHADQLTVGCAGGEVVELVGGAISQIRQTGVEWRDLALTPEGLRGTSFRAAELVTVGQSTTRVPMPAQRVNTSPGSTVLHRGQVAWRMVPAGTRTYVIHQLHANELTLGSGDDPATETPVNSNPYGGTPVPGQQVGCGNSAVVTAITTLENGVVTRVQRIPDVLAVDAALSPDGRQLAVVGAGGTGLSVYPLTTLESTSSCVFASGGVTGMALNSVAWISPTRLAVVESLRSTPMIFDLTAGQMRSLGPDPARGSVAHALFHLAPAGGAPLACASCHPEGGEDGHLWVIDGKPRRTQSLAGGVMQRLPFHWQGELSNLETLMSDTFVRRMGGSALPTDQVNTLAAWLDTLPAPKPSRHLTPAQRSAGLEAFARAGCGGCHLAQGTQEGGVSDIGTGEAVRAPSLSGLFARAPYLHTGEIPDIRTRVTGSLHPQHGQLSVLSASQQEDLIAYLESL